MPATVCDATAADLPGIQAPLLGKPSLLGKHSTIAGIDAVNPASIHLHERLGFERGGALREVRFKFGRWRSLVFIQCFLDPPHEGGSMLAAGTGS